MSKVLVISATLATDNRGTTLEITAIRLPLTSFPRSPLVSDIPPDFQAALIEWLTP